MRGEFNLRAGEDPEVELQDGLVDDPRLRRFPGGVGYTGSAEDSIASFLPITLHGQLDTGEQITLLNACNYGGPGHAFFGTPRYAADAAVLGEHIDIDQPINAIRFRLGQRYWLDHLDKDSTAISPDGATLSVQVSEDGNWLVYIPAAPATLRHLRTVVVSGVRALMGLVLHSSLAAEDIELRVQADQPWRRLFSDALNCSATQTDLDSLLPREVLTLEVIARWIPMNDRLDGLAAAVISPIQGALQAETLVLTSLVEGLHRRLPYQQSKFPALPKEARKAILGAAREAARAQAQVYGIDPSAVAESVQFLTDVSFRMRATQIVNEVCSVIPELKESVPDLPGQITKARNDFAHHLIVDRQKEPLELSYLRWLIVVTATPWLLRALLLLHAGIAADIIREGFLDSNRFEHARANIAQFARELGWELPSPPI
ncbi:hypothetical protein D2E76_28130 [Mycobacteroides abscessus]|uniref:ApeA N-terminal domain-containing protein n=1 Tax=Mycobacteroides abscessus TaxID=36809 RepID=A0ABD7HFN4_9MYCO|nr:hypothetical protein D2E27_14915 [Mycobacteroides abscessus]RIR92162.1 hypothetical protein D2E58_24730 [Mycobacteroides abscessus]RIT26316.1 hypothetical protein D2E76_28130 [Mycobacteroides abscessus]